MAIKLIYEHGRNNSTTNKYCRDIHGNTLK